MDMHGYAKLFCKILSSFPVNSKKSETKESIVVEIGSYAQVEFFKDDIITAMIDIPESNYFHVWEILPNSQDFKHAAEKISSAINDLEIVSNRILNACER